jgi:hypothetical protein
MPSSGEPQNASRSTQTGWSNGGSGRAVVLLHGLDGSVQARYSHVTAEMRRRLMRGLTAEWESALNVRREMSPRSPVVALDALLRAHS